MTKGGMVGWWERMRACLVKQRWRQRSRTWLSTGTDHVAGSTLRMRRSAHAHHDCAWNLPRLRGMPGPLLPLTLLNFMHNFQASRLGLVSSVFASRLCRIYILFASCVKHMCNANALFLVAGL